MNSFSLFWTSKRLKKKRLVSCLVLVALVTAPLICALIFSESMMQGITNKYIHLSDGHLQIRTQYFEELSNEQYGQYIESVDQTVSGYALMYSSTETASVLVKGVGQSYFNEKRLKEVTFSKNEEERSSNIKGIAISQATAKALDVTLGDRVALMIVPDDASKVLRPVLLRIDAIFTSGYDQLDQILTYIDIEYARTLYSSDSSSYLEALVCEQYQMKLDEVVSALPSSSVLSKWSDHNVSVYENFVTSKQVIFIILVLVAIVAAFYTASVAQQMISDDMTDIAIAKLLGCSDSNVRKSAFMSVYAVTCLGMGVGIALGLLIGCNLGPLLSFLSSLGLESLSFYLLNFDITIPWPSIAAISACLLFVSFISIMLTLRKTRHITPMRLFTNL